MWFHRELLRRARRKPYRYVRFGLGLAILIFLSAKWLCFSGKGTERTQIRIAYSKKSRDSLHIPLSEQPNLESDSRSIDDVILNDPLKTSSFYQGSQAAIASHAGGAKSQKAGETDGHDKLEPVTIAIMTKHYFGAEYAREVPGCELHRKPLDCTYIDMAENRSMAALATAVWWHGPGLCHKQEGTWLARLPSNPYKASTSQLAVVATMESSVYHPCFEQKAFLSKFDITSTYRLDSDVPLLYYGISHRLGWETFPEMPFGEKQDAVVFVNSNCNTPSKREVIVAALASQPDLRLDSLGGCLPGPAQLPRDPGFKLTAFRRYKFCIAMENSIAVDYVTEKVYDALAAGCIPIYWGAPNVKDFVPTKDSIIDYRDFMDPEKLGDEIRRLASNETAYQEKLAWRNRPDTWSDAFKRLMNIAEASDHPQCKVCQMVAQRRSARIEEI